MTPERKIRLTILLGFLTALAPLSTDMYLPALPMMHSEFGVEASVIQMTLSMTMIGMAVGPLFAGPISDRFGRKIPLVIGMLCYTLASLGCMVSENITVFLFFRFIQGLSGAFGLVIARAIARDVSTGAELTRFFSTLMMVNGLAPILSPVIGGQILVFTEWRGVFVVLTGIGMALLISTIRLDETLPSRLRAVDVMSSFKSFGTLLQDKYFMGHCLVQCAAFAYFFAYISGSSFLFQNIYHVSPQVYSFIFGGMGVALVLAGMIPIIAAGKIKEVFMLGWSIFQALVGGIAFMACVLNQAPIELTILSLLIMVPTNSVLNATSFSLAMRQHEKDAGAASALMGFFAMFSAGIVTPLVGLGGENNAFPMAVIILVCQIATLIIFVKRIVNYREPQ